MHPIRENSTTAPPATVIYRPLPPGVAFVDYGSPRRRIVNTVPPPAAPYRWGWQPVEVRPWQ